MARLIEDQKIRVVIAKVGLDSHWIGAQVVSQALREAGMEVIYTGNFNTPEAIVKTSVQEDVDIIGLSYMSGGAVTSTSKIMELLKEHKAERVPVIIGGILRNDEIRQLKAMGAAAVVLPGTPLSDVVATVRKVAQKSKSKRNLQKV